MPSLLHDSIINAFRRLVTFTTQCRYIGLLFKCLFWLHSKLQGRVSPSVGPRRYYLKLYYQLWQIPGFPVGGRSPRRGGASTPDATTFCKILYVKTKESGPWEGGRAPGCAPFGSTNGQCFSSLQTENKFNKSMK